MKILITLFTLLSLTSFAQDTKADGILSKLSSKIKSSSTFYVEFNANIKNSSSGLNESNSGKGWVKGDKFHASYGENTRISNGYKSWTIMKEDKTVYVTDADDDDEDAINPKKLMTAWETGFNAKYDKETTLGSEKVHVINLYPKNPKTVEYHTITLYISTSTNELKKATLKSKDGTVMNYTVTKFQSGVDIPDSKFVFDKSKYPGYKVIED